MAARTRALLTLPPILPTAVLGRARAVPPGDRSVMGGIGGRGIYVLNVFLQEPDVQVVAVADVQAPKRPAAKQRVDARYGKSDCVTYRALRELLARPDIDAVLIATGPNWHSVASTLTAEAGKDVYCEKPCTKNIVKSLALAETFHRTARVF